MVLWIKYLKIFKVIIMANQNAKCKGEFSPVSGSSTRRVYDIAGNFKGVIIKQVNGYMVHRVDGKRRFKKSLKEAFASISRVN